ncbi:BEM_HP_G0086790.mRNA.1.CDS.1 [Saccharomyces cerevisiae]|nr:BEM_HP_G0086790.mRNA.1.CDS.1 [Saccharomyces cerevisiae]CAI6998097.1 BEM_HP_G0086790.mRNA.1.CDS.1 [Saccharomyces cerevisiae]
MFFLCLVLLRGDIYSHIRTEFYKVRTLNGVVKRRKKKCSAIYPHYNHRDSLGNGAVPRNLLSTYHPMLM